VLDQARAAAAERLGLDAGRLQLRALSRGVTHDTHLLLLGGSPVAVFRFAPPRMDILPRHTPSQEGELLSLLAGSGLPVPEVLINDPSGEVLGRAGLLLSYAPGVSTLTWEDFRARCGAGIAEHTLATLCRMHALDVAGWPDSHDPGGHAARDLAGARALADEAGVAAPAGLHEVLDELSAAFPEPSGAPCIVHGDYRPANLMAADGRITGILDWEMTTSGDRACDLGIATMAPWGVWWPDEELLRRYRDESGVNIAMGSLLWWRCLGFGKVLAFLARRVADGWDGGPTLTPWAERLAAARRAWHAGS
jgi:aminoglycoside phosphotransferase (APT) family kinase protein